MLIQNVFSDHNLAKRSKNRKLSATIRTENFTSEFYFRSVKGSDFVKNMSFVDPSSLDINKIYVFRQHIMYENHQKNQIYPRLNKTARNTDRLVHKLSPAPLPSISRDCNQAYQQNHIILPMK